MEEIASTDSNLLLSTRDNFRQKVGGMLGRALLFAVTSVAAIGVMFIILFIARDAIPFFRQCGFKEFFTSTHWYPSGEPAEFGALSILVGTGLVTLGAVAVAVPLGVSAAVCLSDVLPFTVRQYSKPVIEVLAAIPSVAFGFFALVVFAPLLQEHGGTILASLWWCIAGPAFGLGAIVLGDVASTRLASKRGRRAGRPLLIALLLVLVFWFVSSLGRTLSAVSIVSGTNALNVSIILGIMALPTIVSVSEDALQAVGRDLREGCYALGATRAETMLKTIIPAASGGILAAVLLGIMRALGETMVVWMASGNAAQIPSPWFDLTQPVRTLTATIAGDMGEADHVTGSARYHVLFAMGLCLLLFSFACNLISEWVMTIQRKKLRGE